MKNIAEMNNNQDVLGNTFAAMKKICKNRQKY